MSDEWPEDDSPTGGIGTITRPPGPPRETPRRPYREPKGAPPSGLRSGGARAGEEERLQRQLASRGTNKFPFFLMLCGLLGGALICALVISTTLAAGSFQITRLQQANASLVKQRQLLQEQVATAQSAQVIQARARELGMRPVGEVRFLNLKKGKVETDAGSGAVRDINVPGYTP